MIAKGMRTAAPVANTTATRSQLRCCAWLLGANGLLPLLEELEPLGLIQVNEERGAHRDGLESAAHRLLQRSSGRFSLHVLPDGEEERLVSDHLLPATREQVVQKHLGRVRVLGRFGNEGDP